MKHIGVDFHVFDGKYQGSRTYLLEVFSRLVMLRDDVVFYFFLNKVHELQEYNEIFKASNVKLVQINKCTPIMRLALILPMMQIKYKLNLLHTQYIMPLPKFGPCVVTIHDTLFEQYPQYFTKLFVIRSKLLMKLSAKYSDHIFTVSEYSKNKIVEQYKVPNDNISVVYNGVDNQRFFPGKHGMEVINRRGLKSGNYILSVGRLEPRKNYLTLLRAYARLGPDVPPLVIAGQRFFGFNDVLRFIDTNALQGRVYVLEDVDNDELPNLYRHAKLFVYPSWAEGFGIPPIEAMASGVPVLCSNSTVFPEIVNDAALLVPPEDELQLAGAIRTILDDKQLCTKMISKGLIQSEKYSWDSAAQKTMEGYDYVLNP